MQRFRTNAAALVLGAFAAAPWFGAIVDEESKASFPDRVTLEGKTLEPAGTGVRKRLWTKVYAAALYLDPAQARERLSRWRGRDSKKLLEEDAFYADVVRLDGPKALELRMLRDVDGSSMRDAMKGALERSMPKLDEDAKRFVEQFNRPMKRGEMIEIHWLPGDRVRAVFEGKPGPFFENPRLAQSLGNTWLGPDPVDEDLKKGLVRRVPAMLR